MYTYYVIINKCSRRNEGKCIANTGFCNTLPTDIQEVDVYYDWSYKIQSRIPPLYQPNTEITMKSLSSLQEENQLLPVEDHWTISKM